MCDLDKDEAISDVVGYNAQGDFVIGSMGEYTLAMPSLNSQEGTFVSINYQLLATNVAVAFEGYCLNDIAHVLGLKALNTIDYTAQLPVTKGFKAVEFDVLGNFYGALGEDYRGYRLETMDVAVEGTLEAIDDLPEFNGTVIYQCNPVNQFNGYTAQTSQLEADTSLRGSAQFAAAARISDGDSVTIEGRDGARVFILDETLKGTIALLPTYDTAFSALHEGYRFEKIKLQRMGS